MTDVRDRKEVLDLNFYLWRIKDERRGEWRKEVLLIGDDNALETMIQNLLGLLDSFYRYGTGTRRYKCNPPRDLDYVIYGHQHRVKIEWLDSLVVKISPDVSSEEPYVLEGKVVTIRVNPKVLNQIIDGARAQLDTSKRYGHGSPPACGLRFSPDWLGIE